jgi:hypothetical protein
MLDLIASLVKGLIGPHLRRVARLVAFAALTLAFGLLAIASGSLALFLSLEQAFGPIRAALVIGAGAAVVALLASVPLWWKAKPPPSQVATLVELAVTVGLALLLDRKAKT